MAQKTIRIFNATALTGTEVSISAAISPRFGTSIGLHIIATGNPTGTFVVHRSNLVAPSATDLGDWVPVPGAELVMTTTDLAAADKNSYLEVPNTTARHYKLVYTNATGTGVLDAHANFDR